MFAQQVYDIRCEWGRKGLLALAPEVDCLIIVDVISFCTCVDIVVGRGGVVYPYHSREADAFTESVGGVLARHEPGSGELWFSATALQATPAGTRLVLPSPNGSTLSTLVEGVPVLAGCLRNARAVAAAAQQIAGRIGVIPAGERWPDDKSLRPALEDWLGAGAIISALEGDHSREAQAAVHTFHAMQDHLNEVLHTVGSGVELIERGRAGDVALAAQLNVSEVAPRLVDGVYR